MNKRSSLLWFSIVGASLICCPVMKSLMAQAPDAESPSAKIEALLVKARTRTVMQVALSPDARRVAWTEGGRILMATVNPYGDVSKTEQVVAAATSADERCRNTDPTWSPDSSSIAYFSDCASSDGQEDLYLSHLDQSPAARLTELHGYVNDPAFSPDGEKIAFLYVEGATRPANALAAEKPPAGVIGRDDVEVQRIAMVAVGGAAPAKPEFVTPESLHAFEFDWSRDSKRLAYVAATPPGENNWWTAKLYRQAIAGGTPEVVLDPVTVAGPLHGLQIAVPRWSPDGKSIAFIGGLMSDQGSTGGDIYVIPSEGKREPVNLTAGRHETAAWLQWTDKDTILYTALAGGDSQVRMLATNAHPPSSGASKGLMFQFPASIGDGRMEGSLQYTRGQFAYIKSSFSEPPEIWYARDVGAECTAPANNVNACNEFFQISHFNDDAKAFWGKTDSIEWTNEGFHIQGWLMLPADYDPAKKYPMIVEVHGGPAAAATSNWGARGSLGPAAFSALGYFVLMPNPRGSFGQGEAFVEANRKDFGYGDLRDILAGVDAVEKKYPVDGKRVGLTGWSYGGFMSMFAVTQTHRFRAAVAGAGISDWLSYYGENSIDEWMIPYFGASVYDDPAVYAKMSAVNYIKNAKTPTLAVVGDRDGECPAPQSFEFWHALKAQHVPTELVVYPNEGHGFVNPEHRRDVLDRAVEWFAKYMPAE